MPTPAPAVPSVERLDDALAATMPHPAPAPAAGVHGAGGEPARGPLGALTLGALGVVYGDIGTSPLYTMKEVLNPANGSHLDAAGIVGAVSVILWALVVVVTLKYVVLILRADNRGEGGILALTALATRASGALSQRRRRLLVVGVLGAALFYGDSVITPAISVLGAVEGLETLTPAFKPYVVPISAAVLVALFVVQRRGTATVGALFGPVMVAWFAALAVAGAWHVAQAPQVLAALDPRHAWEFLSGRGWLVLVAVGSIVLALTGAEALYADMGHFGRAPIRLAWTAVVLPSLALVYLGQGALLLREPAALDNPFFRLFPGGWLLPALALATAASVIASQAVISGAFSLTKEAIQLGLMPRMQILHTSERAIGQIYLPGINWALMVAVLLAVFGFRGSSALAAAYGIAVTITMLLTTVLTYFVVRHVWRYPAALAIAATGFFLVIDAVMVAACSLKIHEGGWFPLLLGLALFTLMMTWQRGRERLRAHEQADQLPLAPFVESLAAEAIPRCPRTAVYLSGHAGRVPGALLHNLKHYHVLHERNVVVHVRFAEVPWVPESERVSVRALAAGFWEVAVLYGFKDEPDVPAALARAAAHGLALEPAQLSYFLSRELIVPGQAEHLAAWRARLFATMARNAGNAADYFRLPNNAVVELGARVRL